MPSPETEYFSRLARVGVVVFAMFVLGYFVLRARERTQPPAPVPVDSGVPVILLENAGIVEDDPAVVSADEYLARTPIVPAGLSGSQPDSGKVTFDLGDANPAALRIAPLPVDVQTTAGDAWHEPHLKLSASP